MAETEVVSCCITFKGHSRDIESASASNSASRQQRYRRKRIAAVKLPLGCSFIGGISISQPLHTASRQFHDSDGMQYRIAITWQHSIARAQAFSGIARVSPGLGGNGGGSGLPCTPGCSIFHTLQLSVGVASAFGNAISRRDRQHRHLYTVTLTSALPLRSSSRIATAIGNIGLTFAVALTHACPSRHSHRHQQDRRRPPRATGMRRFVARSPIVFKG